MPPVEPRPHPAVNPDASRSVRRRARRRPPHNGARATAGSVLRGRCARATSAGSAAPPGAVRPHVPCADTLVRSSGCRDRSSCTARPGCGIARTGTGGRVGPCAPRHNRSAGRTRPSTPHCCGTTFIGTVSGAVRSSSLPASQTVAAPTFFGIERVVPRRAHSAVGRHRRRDRRHHRHCPTARASLAALQGGQAGTHTSIKTRPVQQPLLGSI